MYLMIEEVGENAPELSWLLFKHPETVATKPLGSRATVRGRFLAYGPQHAAYALCTITDPTSFIDYCKRMNLPSYVRFEEHGVTPVLIGCVSALLSSALKGSVPVALEAGVTEEIGKEMVERTRVLSLDVGPLDLYKSEFFAQMLRGAGLGVRFVSSYPGVGTATIFGEMPLVEFLQKAYTCLVAVANSGAYDDMGIPALSQAEKMARYSAAWIGTHPMRERLIRLLAGSRRNEKAVREVVDVEPPEKDEAAMALKERRYTWFVDQVSSMALSPTSRLLDLGCGSGNLLVRLMHASDATGNPRMVGVESDPKALSIARRRMRRSPHVVRMGNVLFPSPEFTDVDVAVLCEVLEHIDPGDATDRLLEAVLGYLQPKRVLLSTPNVAWNVKRGFERYRHPDHRIEYDEAGLRTVLDKAALYGYTYTLDVLGEPIEGVCPTFVARLVSRLAQVDGGEMPARRDIGMDAILAPFTILEGYEVRSEQMLVGAEGYNGRKEFIGSVLHMAPTMSPPSAHEVQVEGYLEHPLQVFDYYRAHGVWDLRAQQKYMGSRGTVVAAVDPALWAKHVGPLSKFGAFAAYSRNLYPLFRTDTDTEQVRDVVFAAMRSLGADLIVLDGELLPWSYLARGLIHRSFRLPGGAAVLDRTTARGWGMAERDVAAAQLFMDNLANFDMAEPVSFCLFDIPAVLMRGGYPPYFSTEFPTSGIESACADLAKLGGAPLRSVVGWGVDLREGDAARASQERCIAKWEQYCQRGEGFVFKPEHPEHKTPAAQAAAAMKCRGREYLRLIYGIDYLSNLQALYRRGTNRKRDLARKQNALSQLLVRAACAGAPLRERLPYIFGFSGLDTLTRVNATL